jgi:hypothetical protein
MKRRIWLVGLLTVLLLALASPLALAQGPDGDRFVVGQSFTLPAGEKVNGNLTVMGGAATLESGSAVQGDVAVFGGNLTVAGTVQGNVAIFGGLVTLQKGAVVNGNLAALGGTIERDPDAVVSGEIFDGLPFPFPLSQLELLNELPAAPQKPWPPLAPAQRTAEGGVLGVLGSLVLWQLSAFGLAFILALLGIVAISVAPKAMERIASAASSDTLVSFGAGLLTLVVGFLLGLLLLIACCIGLLGWLALGIAWLVGWLAVGLWLGQRLLQALNVRNASSIGEVALGVVLITVLSRVPWCIGFFFGAIVGCIGLGAVVLTRFGTQPPASKQPRGDAPSDAAPFSALTPFDSPTASASEPPVVADIAAEAGSPAGEAPIVLDDSPQVPAPDNNPPTQ